MSLPILRSFVEVYRCGSISEAARTLDLTQPAVSQHILALETQLGRALFRRHVKGVQPTAVAIDLAQQIGDSLDRAEAALAMTKARSATLSGTVHIAGPAEFMTATVAPHLSVLLAAGLNVRLHLGGKADLYSLLQEGQVDLAFTASTPSDRNLAFAAVATERLLAVTSPSNMHGLTDLHDLGENLSALPALAYDPDMPLLRAWCALNRLDLGTAVLAVTAPDLRILRSLVVSGLGWTVLPDYLCVKAVSYTHLTLPTIYPV